jgi:energy-coupling factor transporter ATP-binding protein EcfA2
MLHAALTCSSAPALNQPARTSRESLPEDADRRDQAPPAYFLSLRIANFRSFGPEQMLDLSDSNGKPARWTVLLGDNGTGKTTLLQSLASLQLELDDDQYFPQASPSFVLNGTRAGEGDVLLVANAAYGTLLTGLLPVAGTNLLEVRTETSDLIEKNRRSMFSVSSDPGLRGLVCYGYGATRRMGPASLSENWDDDETESLFSDEAYLINAEEWLLQSDYAALTESPLQERARRRRDEVVEVLIKLLPDVSDIRFRLPSVEPLKPRVEVETPYGWVALSALSLGYRTLTAWIVDLAYRLFQRYPDSVNPLAEPAVVLVDELDLHLHPKWQRTIISYLTERFPNTQFIVSAHSPLIVQAATDANIVLLRREGDHVVIDNDVEAIRGWRIDQVLTSDLFGLESARPPEFEDLLKERNKILGKSKLTKADERRLKQLDATIGNLPAGETPEDAKAMEIIRRAAEVLKKQGAAGA